jgi:DNA-binding NarL/FixJ family response regulator
MTTTVEVVVVDDEPLFRQAVVAVVAETDGFTVVAAVGTGEDAVEAVQRLRPDLVVMDVNLPGIDGLEATRAVLAGTPAEAVPPVVLLLSTYDDDLGADLVVQSGAAGYLTKSAMGPDALRAAWAASRPG